MGLGGPGVGQMDGSEAIHGGDYDDEAGSPGPGAGSAREVDSTTGAALAALRFYYSQVRGRGEKFLTRRMGCHRSCTAPL